MNPVTNRKRVGRYRTKDKTTTANVYTGVRGGQQVRFYYYRGRYQFISDWSWGCQWEFVDL